MKCLMEDADKRRHESETVKNCIAEIRDLADRAEDAIEIYAARVLLKRRRGMKKVLCRYACILKECQSLHQLDSEISEIKSGLERVRKQMKDYGIIKKIIHGGESSDNQKWGRITYPDLEEEDCFLGMEKELKQLVCLIEGEEHRVISVWGMGGLGKTTIAKKVYHQMKNLPKPASRFDRFAWVCITQQFKIRSVLESVVNQLDPPRQRSEKKPIPELMVENVVNQLDPQRQRSEKQPIPELMERLCEIQRAHRCLIVIDDLWKTSHWNEFKHAFRAQGLKSKILVTTRNQKVAQIGSPLKLGLLNMDEAWELLKKKTFPHPNIIPVDSQEKLHKMGKEMLRKCGRLPLAISLLGGVLRKKSMDEWESVQENMRGYMSKAEGDDEDEYGIKDVLGLSYDDLPYYLKPCFLYLGTLAEDETIDALVLYRLWIAQGMISSEGRGGQKGSLMDIAEIYLSELASRCIVEVVEVEDITPKKLYGSCKLHDVVREQCLFIGEKENFGSLNLKLPGGNHKISLPRYVVIHVEGKVDQEVDELANKDADKHVRSLKIIAQTEQEFSEEINEMYVRIIEFPAKSIVDFQRFKMLRDLVVFGFAFPGRKFPRGITDLVHLRCLRLLECELDELPSSISKLVYLEILDLEYSKNVRIPNVLKKMFRLKHLLLPFYTDQDTIENYGLRLDEGLDELETPTGFDSKVHELKCSSRMKNLRRLSAVVHNNKILSDIINAINDKNWSKLQSCDVSILEGCQLTSEEGWKMMKKVFSFPNLHYLAINVELGKLPVESMNDMISSKLVALYLSCSKMEDDPMGILGKLPFLHDLGLLWGSFLGEEMTCTASSFPRLKKLYLGFLPKLREWRVEAGAMRLLSLLYIFDCPRLEMVPDGLSRISTLKKLTISGMPELGKRVTPSGDDFHKVCHVPSIHIHDRSPFTQDEV